MDHNLKQKSDKLDQILKSLDNMAIAFSGGVDSSFLLHRASEIMKDKVMAITVDTVYIPKREIEEAIAIAKKYNVKHKIITLPLMEIIKHNPNDRCYFCKTFIFKQLLNEAAQNNITCVAEGTNADDTSVYRPGLKALEELKILSPLKEAGLTKEDIRNLSREKGMETWDKPAYACLLTRIPYGTEITEKELSMIEKSENYLISLGFNGARVRSHGNLARIEVLQHDLNKIMNEKLLLDISLALKKFGYQFVTLDTEGYKSGSFDHIKS